jgi:polysaccharide deacetylase family protein (PEP-CTERM system associated)
MNVHVKESSQNPAINAFSVDVEGFVESNAQSFDIPHKYINHFEEDREIEQNTDVLLEILDHAGTKGTFFFLGRLANDIPDLVRRVAQAGHEIGCHSYLHLRIFGIDKNEFREKLTAAKKNLEDVSGQPVYGFRAPDFSITRASIWAVDVLKEAGFVYDSSIYPVGLHDVYGIKDAEPSVHMLSNGLIEFPLPTAQVFGRRIPFGGGGYLRLYPLWLTRLFIAILNKRNIPCIFYIHPYEVGPVIPKIAEISPYRKFRHYYRCQSGAGLVAKLLKAFRFAPAIEVLRRTGLVSTPKERRLG